MATNDMHVIICKILKYIYSANKEDKHFTYFDMLSGAQLTHVNNGYLNKIIKEMMENGLISDVSVTTTKDGYLINVDNARITIKGVDMYENDTMIAKAKVLLGKAFEIAVSAAIAALN